MTRPSDLDGDFLVIGAGVAGLVCAMTLARSGKDVAVLSRGTPASHMSSGCVNGLRTHVLSTICGAERAASASEEAARMFLEMTAKSGLRYDRPKGALIDGHGMAHRADLAPIWMLQGKDIDSARRITILAQHDECRLLETVLSGRSPDIKTTRAALPNDRARPPSFEDLEAAMGETDGDLVVITPTLPLQGFDQKMSMLEARLGGKVREVFSPLQLHGQRMHQALLRQTIDSGVKVHDGMEVVGLDIERSAITQVSVRSGMRSFTWRPKVLVHCGGGIIGGGLDIAGDRAIDPLSVFDITSVQVGPDQHPIMGQGLRVDEQLHPYHNDVRLENVLAAGSVLPGVSYPLGAGMGTAMSSAVLAAKGVLDVR